MKGPRGHKIKIEKELDPSFPAPTCMLGYLAPSVGAFTLSQDNDSSKGHASFVWHHLEPHGKHSHFDVDWHDDSMKYVGGLINNEYWCYEVIETPPGQDGPVYIAFAREIIADSESGKNDEGYRIIYVDHGFVHLWAWNASTFMGHDEDHDDHDGDHDGHDDKHDH